MTSPGPIFALAAVAAAAAGGATVKEPATGIDFPQQDELGRALVGIGVRQKAIVGPLAVKVVSCFLLM